MSDRDLDDLIDSFEYQREKFQQERWEDDDESGDRDDYDPPDEPPLPDFDPEGL